jgi:hypothetical protein
MHWLIDNSKILRIAATSILAFWSFFCIPCLAQETRLRSEGYLFVAPGIRTHEEAATAIVHAGGGGEVFVRRGFSVGAEFGYLRPWSESYEDLGMVSMSAFYHSKGTSRWAPFVFAGVSFALRDRTLGLHRGFDLENSAETLTLLNYGVGNTFWLKPRKGLRVEIRDHHYTAETDRHYLELRIGFAFR